MNQEIQSAKNTLPPSPPKKKLRDDKLNARQYNRKVHTAKLIAFNKKLSCH